MRILLIAPRVDTLDDPDDPALDQATELLAASVPSSCAGLVPYHASGYRSFLAAAVTPAAAHRTLILRAIRGTTGLRAVADWRLLPGQLLLNGVSVRTEERGQGLGSRLLDDGRELAEQLGCRALLLDVSLDNPAAHRLYLRSGFSELTRSRWRDVPTTTEAAPADVRVVDWPSFAAHRDAYGFGDLTVRTGGREVVVRVVGTAVRVPADPGAGGIAAAVAHLLPVARSFTIESGTDDSPALAAFVRMRRELPGTVR